MNTKTFKPEPNETDKEFRERVERFADEVSTLAIQFMDDGENGEATSAEVIFWVGGYLMRKVEHFMNLYQQNKITTRQPYKRLGARKYHEWWNKIYKEASGNEQNC